MLVLVIILPLVAALLCLALNRSAPTRWLGFGAAAALAAGVVVLLAGWLRSGLPLALLDYTWLALGDRPVRLQLLLDAASCPLALLVLGGGALGLLALALAVPLDLRGFGGLFAAVLLALLASVVALANQDLLLLPFAWALSALMIFAALRASGALAGSDAPLVVLLAGLMGVMLLLGAGLAPAGAPVALVCWTVVSLLALGVPPFHSDIQALAEAPAALSGLLLALGLPLLGGYTLIRLVAAQGAQLPPGWRVIVMALGLLTLLACGAGAAGTTSLRRATGWQFSAQMGLLLIAVAQGGAGLTAVAPALLVNTALATLACFLAIAIVERQAGTDDFAEIAARESLLLPGMVFLVGAASASGLPGTLGFWPRRWLLDDLAGAAPWMVPPLLAGSALLAFTYIAPLAMFWRAPEDVGAGRPALNGVTCGLAAAPLIVLGVAPELAWRGWLLAGGGLLASEVGAGAPALPAGWTHAWYALAAVLLLGLPLSARLGGRRAAPLDVRPVGIISPQTLGQSLRGLAWLGIPAGVFLAIWQALLGLSRAIRRGLALFEQRYYLAGLVIAVIVVVMLFIQ
jgi:multicomponent Na+:H+ antiporter subunit A